MYTMRETRPKIKHNGNTKREQLWHRVEVLDKDGNVFCMVERILLREAKKAAKTVMLVMNGQLF
jgi:hypothetical protein